MPNWVDWFKFFCLLFLDVLWSQIKRTWSWFISWINFECLSPNALTTPYPLKNSRWRELRWKIVPGYKWMPRMFECTENKLANSVTSWSTSWTLSWRSFLLGVFYLIQSNKDAMLQWYRFTLVHQSNNN